MTPPEERKRQARRQRVEHVVGKAVADEVGPCGPARRRRVGRRAAAIFGVYPGHGLLIAAAQAGSTKLRACQIISTESLELLAAVLALA